jgi:hypothetical protein
MLVALAAAFHRFTDMSIVGPTLHIPSGETKPLVFPFRGDAPSDSVVVFSFRIPKRRLTQPGDHLIVARVLNRGGQVGLDARPDVRDWRNVLEAFSVGSGLLIVLVVALRRLGWVWPLVAPFAFGLAARLAYLFVTPPFTRTHDVQGHLDYIEYLLAHHSLPRPYDGWSFYQPPLYYVAGAALWGGLRSLGIESRDTALFGLQVQSLFYQLGFLAFSLRAVGLWMDQLPQTGFGSRLCSRPAFTALAAALLCLWPSAIIHSVRIGNDDLLYLFFGAGVYFASRWWIGGQPRDFTRAALSGAFAMLTKSNGLLVFVLLGILLGVRFASDGERKLSAYLRWTLPGLALFALATIATLGRAAIDTASGRRPNLLVANANQLGDNLAVGNHAINYLWFDTKIFVTQPFFSPFDDANGRQYFWNSALKTGLFGEFAFDRGRLADLAAILSVLFLVILTYVVAGIANTARQAWRSELPALLLIATLMASLAALRMSIPMACSSDFRYVLPVLTPFAYLYARGLARFRELGWNGLSSTGAILGWSFAVLSGAFFCILTALG